MERFRNIDWHPALEDMIDNVFIKDEKMQQESAMYKIMNGNFTNPFEDTENLYADVNLDLIKKYLQEDGETITDMEDENQQENQVQQKQQEKSYVPGIRKLPFYFPRKSHLYKNQQALCLRVLLRLSSNESKGINEVERKELEEYMALQETISSEQKEFLEFAKSKWDSNYNWSIKSAKFIALKWQTKIKRFQKLPRYYVESMNVPLSIQTINLKNKDVKITFTSCLQQGTFSNVVLPKLDRPFILFMKPSQLLETYPPCIAPDKTTLHFRLPVSEDPHCENLANQAEADFVISSSGLKCLLNNLNQNHTKSWIIPVVVKSHNDKNIVYVDKQLPPSKATIPQKNTWVYKYILRYYFVDAENELSKKTEDKLENSTNDSNSDNSNDSFSDYLKQYKEKRNLYSSNAEKLEELNKLKKSDELEKLDNIENNKMDSKISNQQNVLYNLFTIEPIESLEHEHNRIKYGVKKYRMLVRTKIDGIEVLPNGESQFLVLTPKLEHQLGFGAEAVTIEEALHQWASLKFRPNTSLARVRIAADTAEIIQIERHTTTSLSGELKRLYNIKVEDSLSILHNIIEGLSSLTPGQYIMRYIPRNGPFACVYKQSDYRTNVFDLHTTCESILSLKFRTIREIPWPRIDNMITTPMLRCFQRMPAMFNPNISQKQSGRPKGRPKKNTNINNGQAITSLRRSNRLKKTDEL